MFLLAASFVLKGDIVTFDAAEYHDESSWAQIIEGLYQHNGSLGIVPFVMSFVIVLIRFFLVVLNPVTTRIPYCAS